MSFPCLKPFVMPLPPAVPEEDPNAMEVIRLRKFMNYFLPFTDLEAIPNTSIIREFVGGSGFEEEQFRRGKKSKLNVALLQIMPESTEQENLKKGLKACREAKKAGADIALFPEMWSTGYRMDDDPQKLKAAAISAESEFILTFGRLGGASYGHRCHTVGEL